MSSRAMPAHGGRRDRLALVCCLVLGAHACVAPPAVDRSVAPERLRVKVVRRTAHDPAAFTQGLLWHDGQLFESTGRYGQSTLRQVDPTSGRVARQVALDDRYFGEGLALVGRRLIQLTWQRGVALVWDLGTFEQVESFAYAGEGWGLCFDGLRLVMSDGSDRLTFRDPASFAETGRIAVTNAGRPVQRLNELECVDGLVYANVWQTEEIVRIDPETGIVTGVIDASGLLDGPLPEVLNGIAYVPTSQRFLITGKLWPRMFEVEFEPAPTTGN